MVQPQLRGKSWLHEKLPSGYSASLGFGGGGSDASDPTSVLRLVSAVSSHVANVGSESVRDTTTTHYRADVDFGKAAAKRGIPAADIAALEKALGQVAELGALKTLPQATPSAGVHKG